jgi:ABC-2 type transport system permease protein
MNQSLTAIWYLFYREVLRFTRQRSRWIGALATPLLFWFMIGGGVGASFGNTTGEGSQGYFEFMFPGILVMAVLFTSIFSTISVIEDRHQGFLQGVLISPVRRWTFVLAKILSGAALGIIQAGLLLLVALLTGVQLDLGAWTLAIVLLFGMGLTLTALGFVFAWMIDSVQGFHGIMNLVLMPMWILSGSLFPVDRGPRILQIIGKINPLSYAVKPLRELIATSHTGHLPAGLTAMGAAFLALFFVSCQQVEKSH